MSALSFLDKEHSIAHPGYSRWLVPPAALAIHLSIGQVYAYSVFKIPLTHAIGIEKSAPGDWNQPQIAWMFSIAIVFLGVSAAVFGHLNSVSLFVGICVLIISMYGGGFATIPAYLRDLFGTHHVSAIHGRLLTAWSVAGIAGPMLVNQIRVYRLNQGVDPASAYSTVLYVMAALLVLGFICNLLVRPVSSQYYEADANTNFGQRGFPVVQKA